MASRPPKTFSHRHMSSLKLHAESTSGSEFTFTEKIREILPKATKDCRSAVARDCQEQGGSLKSCPDFQVPTVSHRGLTP